MSLFPPIRRHLRRLRHDEDASLVTEYGLLAVVAATICGVIIAWASSTNAFTSMFNALLRHARDVVVGA